MTLILRLNNDTRHHRMRHHLIRCQTLTCRTVDKRRTLTTVTTAIHTLPPHVVLNSSKDFIGHLMRNGHVPTLIDPNAPTQQRATHIRINREKTALSHKRTRSRKLPDGCAIRVSKSCVHDLTQRHRLLRTFRITNRSHRPQVLVVATHTVAVVRHHNILALHTLWEHTCDSHRLTVLIKDTIAHLEQTNTHVSPLICHRNQLIIRMSLTSTRRGQKNHVTHLRTRQRAHQRDLLVLSAHNVTSRRRKLSREVSQHRVLVVQTIVIKQIFPPSFNHFYRFDWCTSHSSIVGNHKNNRVETGNRPH